MDSMGGQWLVNIKGGQFAYDEETKPSQLPLQLRTLSCCKTGLNRKVDVS